MSTTPARLRAVEAFVAATPTGRRRVTLEEQFDADDPIVAGREHLFLPVGEPAPVRSIGERPTVKPKAPAKKAAKASKAAKKS